MTALALTKVQPILTVRLITDWMSTLSAADRAKITWLPELRSALNDMLVPPLTRERTDDAALRLARVSMRPDVMSIFSGGIEAVINSVATSARAPSIVEFLGSGVAAENFGLACTTLVAVLKAAPSDVDVSKVVTEIDSDFAEKFFQSHFGRAWLWSWLCISTLLEASDRMASTRVAPCSVEHARSLARLALLAATDVVSAVREFGDNITLSESVEECADRLLQAQSASALYASREAYAALSHTHELYYPPAAYDTLPVDTPEGIAERNRILNQSDEDDEIAAAFGKLSYVDGVFVRRDSHGTVNVYVAVFDYSDEVYEGVTSTEIELSTRLDINVQVVAHQGRGAWTAAPPSVNQLFVRDRESF